MSAPSVSRPLPAAALDAGASAVNRLVWDDALNIGLPLIDEQHKALFGIIGKLVADPRAALQSESVVDRLTELGKALNQHFTIEESLMRQLGMADEEFRAHREDHSTILDQYAEICILSMSHPTKLVKDIAPQVIRWALEHVTEFDHGIKKYLPVV